MGNIIKAILHRSTVCKTAPLYQYDYGQILQIVGPDELPSAYEVHFSNQPHGTATTQIGGADGVAIPDAYLQTGSPVYAWLYLHTGEDDGETEYSITIPVITRARPTNETPTPVQQDAITEAIAALNSGVERAEAAADGIEQTVNDALAAAKASGEFDGKDGTDGTDGIDGVTFTPSVSPSGVLSWTNDGGRQNPESVNIKGAPGQNGLDGMDGVDGKDGADGVSPTIVVSSITGGHRLTITDAQGTQTVDVLDGTDGDDGRGIVSIEKTGTSGLVDTYTITYTDNTTATFTVTNGADGSPGASAYVWIRYAATEPTQDSDMKTTPDAWMGIYSGDSATAPTAYTAYTWYNIKGQTGPVQDVQVNGTSVVTGGVANVPVASYNGVGVVKVNNSLQGLLLSSSTPGLLMLSPATDSGVKSGSDAYRPIVPTRQHRSVFYGLAKAAGDTTQSASENAVGTYTETARSKISDMLNAPVSVSGSTPSITALPGIQYVCGECSTLDIILPTSGIVDVVFTSGSTPTVLTITPQTGMTAEWANDFDSTALKADTLYELNIKMVGTKCLGVAGQWT